MKKLLLTMAIALGMVSSASAITAWDLDGKVMAVRFGGSNAQLGAPVSTIACEIEAKSNTRFVLKDFFQYDLEDSNGEYTNHQSWDLPVTINTSTNSLTLDHGTLYSKDNTAMSFCSYEYRGDNSTGYSFSDDYYSWSSNYYCSRVTPSNLTDLFTSNATYDYQSNFLSTNKNWVFNPTTGIFAIKVLDFYPIIYNLMIFYLVDSNAIAIDYDSEGNATDSYKLRVDKSGSTVTIQNIYNLGVQYSYDTYYTTTQGSRTTYTKCDIMDTPAKSKTATIQSSATTSTNKTYWKTGTLSNNNLSIPSGILFCDLDFTLDSDDGYFIGNDFMLSRQNMTRYEYHLSGKHTGSNLTSLSGKYTAGSKKHTTVINWDEKSGGNLKTYEYNNAYELGDAYLYLKSPNSGESGDVNNVAKSLIMLNPVDVTADIDLTINKFGSDKNHGVFVNATIKPNANMQHIDHLELMMVPGKFNACTANGFTHCPNNGHTLGQSLHSEDYDIDVEEAYHPLAVSENNSYTVAKLIPYDQIENPSANPADYSFFVKAVYTDGLEHTFHALATSDITTSVDDIIVNDFAPEAEKVYFYLDGREVHGELTPGIYVCKQGKIAKKVVIK